MEERTGKSARRGRGYHHGDLRRALVGAALEILEGEGLGALSLRRAARRAGVSQAAPYNHFENLGALLAAVAEEGYSVLRTRMEEGARGRGGGPLGRLTAAGAAYARFAQEHPAWFRLMFGPEMSDKGPYPGAREAYWAGHQAVVGLVEEAQREGSLRAGDPEGLTRTFRALVHGVAVLALDEREGPPRGSTDEVTATVEAAVARLYEGIGVPSSQAGEP